MSLIKGLISHFHSKTFCLNGTVCYQMINPLYWAETYFDNHLLPSRDIYHVVVVHRVSLRQQTPTKSSMGWGTQLIILWLWFNWFGRNPLIVSFSRIFILYRSCGRERRSPGSQLNSALTISTSITDKEETESITTSLVQRWCTVCFL